MITLLCGDNDYELSNSVAQLRADFSGEPERYVAADLTTNQIADIFAGQSLFSSKRLVLIDDPNANTELWKGIEAWAARLSDDTHVVLIEAKPDKRTNSYKWLKKHAQVREQGLLDDAALSRWLSDYAKGSDVSLTKLQQQLLLRRAGNDQWELAHAVDKLALADQVTEQLIEDVTVDNTAENVFGLFETVLHGDVARLSASIERLRLSEEPYRILALIQTQALQLAALVYGKKPATAVAADLAAKSAYLYQKLAPYASRLSTGQAKALLEQLAHADRRLKTTDASPWLVLESTLAGLASEIGS